MGFKTRGYLSDQACRVEILNDGTKKKMTFFSSSLLFFKENSLVILTSTLEQRLVLHRNFKLTILKQILNKFVLLPMVCDVMLITICM